MMTERRIEQLANEVAQDISIRLDDFGALLITFSWRLPFRIEVTINLNDHNTDDSVKNEIRRQLRDGGPQFSGWIARLKLGHEALLLFLRTLAINALNIDYFGRSEGAVDNLIHLRRMWKYVHRKVELTLEELAHLSECELWLKLFKIWVLASQAPAFEDQDDEEQEKFVCVPSCATDQLKTSLYVNPVRCMDNHKIFHFFLLIASGRSRFLALAVGHLFLRDHAFPSAVGLRNRGSRRLSVRNFIQWIRRRFLHLAACLGHAALIFPTDTYQATDTEFTAPEVLELLGIKRRSHVAVIP
jgi:hypothetical protein